MSKTILMMVIALGLASLASALPTGPGGTFYFDVGNSVTANQKLYYLDVDTTWVPLLPSNAVVGYATINTVAGGSTFTGSNNVNHEAWLNPVSGRFDMNGSYHNATLCILARYNNTPDPQSLNQGSTGGDGYIGADLLLVAPDGTPTIINDGFNITSSSAGSGIPCTTASFNAPIVIDHNFTPNAFAWGTANSPVGVAIGGNYARNLWADSDANGYVDDSWAVQDLFSSSAGYTKYFTSGQMIGNKQTTGVIMNNEYGGGVNQVWHFAPTALEPNGSYQKIVWYSYDADPTFIAPTGNTKAWDAADTDGDGILDIYYESLSYNMVHGQDQNNDGDWIDYNETHQFNPLGTAFPSGQSMDDLQLINTQYTPDGWTHPQWIMAWWDFTITSTTAQTYALRYVTLDQYGDWDQTGGTVPTTILQYTVSTAGATGDSTLGLIPLGQTTGFGAMHLVFVPLSEGVIPEPATLLLVGTGVLGLAGVLRRRILG